MRPNERQMIIQSRDLLMQSTQSRAEALRLLSQLLEHDQQENGGNNNVPSNYGRSGLQSPMIPTRMYPTRPNPNVPAPTIRQPSNRFLMTSDLMDLSGQSGDDRIGFNRPTTAPPMNASGRVSPVSPGSYINEYGSPYSPGPRAERLLSPFGRIKNQLNPYTGDVCSVDRGVRSNRPRTVPNMNVGGGECPSSAPGTYIPGRGPSAAMAANPIYPTRTNQNFRPVPYRQMTPPSGGNLINLNTFDDRMERIDRLCLSAENSPASSDSCGFPSSTPSTGPRSHVRMPENSAQWNALMDELALTPSSEEHDSTWGTYSPPTPRPAPNRPYQGVPLMGQNNMQGPNTPVYGASGTQNVARRLEFSPSSGNNGSGTQTTHDGRMNSLRMEACANWTTS